jgi:hypothetical protein
VSTLTITNAGLDYKNAVLAGTEQTNITHMLFANVPGIDATTAPSVESTIPEQHIVHSQTVKRVSNLDGNALVISAILDYNIGDFEFNWFGAVATKGDGEQILVAVVHTHPQTKTKTNGPNVGDYSVKSIVWQSQQLGENVAVNIATQPWQVENDVFATIEHVSNSYLGKTAKAADSAKLEGKTKAQVISEARNGLLKSNGSKDLTITKDRPKIYFNSSHDTGIDVSIGVEGENFFIREPEEGNKEWFKIRDDDNAFIFGHAVYHTGHKPTPYDIHPKLQQLTSSGFHFTPNDLKIHNKRALVGHTHDDDRQSKFYVNYGDDWENVWAGGTWHFNHPIKIKGGSLDYKASTQGGTFKLNTENGCLFVGPQNNNYCHYETDKPKHWFNKPVCVAGEIYAGSAYNKRVFHQGFLPTTGELGVYSKVESDSNYLGKTAKAADSVKLEGKTKAQVISEARNGLAQVNSSPTFKNATFDNGTSTTVNINADSNGMAVLNVCSGTSDAQTTGRVYVGQSLNHGGGIEYNGDNNPVTTGAGADYVTLFRSKEGNVHWTARNYFASNNWEFRNEVKAQNFKEGTILLQDKYHPKSDKLARFESSLIDTNGGQDLFIRNKRALVGLVDGLSINHGTDWQNVRASGKWHFTDEIKANGDITVTKNNPWLTLDSSRTGNAHNEQAAGISLGENGRNGGASLHLTYTGDGYSYIGMGGLGSDNIADNWAMKMQYQSTWVQFRSAVLLGNGNTNLSKGSHNSLRIKTNHGYVDIGPQNSGFCHYATSLSNHWFNRDIKVKGEIYAGPDYNKRVLHEGNISSYAEKRTVKASGTLTANSKNHLTATATFTLPDVTNLSEGTTVVTSKAMAVTPTIKTHGTEHIAMMRGTTMLTDTSVLFDRHCTLTFILNSAKNWEMQ